MKKITLPIILLFLFFNMCFAQSNVGFVHDINGFPLNGYYDPFTYAPEEAIFTVHNSDSYEVGYYYDANGQKINGLIKFDGKEVLFKENSKSKKAKLYPGDILQLVIGVDSFVAINNFYIKKTVTKNYEFVKYITEYDGLTFMKHYRFSSAMGQAYADQSPIIETFLVKHKDSLVWDNFHNNKHLEKRALKYFGHLPFLKEIIINSEYLDEDIISIIKMAEYEHMRKNAEPIFYDKYWQEIKTKNDAKYYANIVNREDSIWTFEYFDNATKLYSVDYSSFYPNVKSGQFVAYHSNGKTRQVAEYKSNKPQEVKLYNKEGKLTTHYKYEPYENIQTGETEYKLKYVFAADASGKNIFEEPGTGSTKTYDDINKITYHSMFEEGELVKFYRVDEKDTLFQITDPEYNFKIKALNKSFNYYISEFYIDSALLENAQGTILVSLIIDDKGYLSKCKLLNELHPELDKLVSDFFIGDATTAAYSNHKFKPYKVDRKKRFCEVIIPVEFGINKFYRKPAQYYHHNNTFWMQHQQWHQQTIDNIKVPTFPK